MSEWAANGQTAASGRGTNPDDPAATTHDLHPDRDDCVYIDAFTELPDDQRSPPVPADQVEHLHVLTMLSRGMGGFRSETDIMGDATIYHSLDLWPDIDRAGVDQAASRLPLPFLESRQTR